MLDSFKFVQGAVKKNTINPELEHYIIKGGRVTGFNGHMALSAPCGLDIEAMPNADMFFKALSACGGTIGITLLENGAIGIKSEGFRAVVPCTEKAVFDAKPQGTMYPAPVGLVEGFKKVLPFVSEDASRPWSMGILVNGGCYTATNNVTIIQQWDGNELPMFNCPRFAAAEVIRIGVNPIQVQCEENSVTFHYEDGRWLRTQLLANEWPAERMNEIMSAPCDPKPLPTGFAVGVEKLAPFTAGVSSAVAFGKGFLTTATDPESEDNGVAVDIDGLPAGPVFSIKQLLLIKDVVDRIDFGSKPCIFYGDKCRGAVMGMTR